MVYLSSTKLWRSPAWHLHQQLPWQWCKLFSMRRKYWAIASKNYTCLSCFAFSVYSGPFTPDCLSLMATWRWGDTYTASCTILPPSRKASHASGLLEVTRIICSGFRILRCVIPPMRYLRFAELIPRAHSLSYSAGYTFRCSTMCT